MTEKAKESQRHQGGTIRPAPNKRGGWDCYVRVDGVDHRARKGTLSEAKAWIDMVRFTTQAQREPLTPIQMADAVHAVQLLPPGATLTEAARAYAEQAGTATGESPRIVDAIGQYLADRRRFVGKRTISGYENTLTRVESFIGGTLRDATPPKIEGFLRGMKGETRNSKIRHLSAFFEWCRKRGMCGASPMAQIEKAARVDAEIHVLTVDQATALVQTAAAVRPDMVPYFALALFAGIRPEELARLPVAKVGREFVLIDGAVAKKRRRRTVPIRPNLRAWLDTFKPDGELVRWGRYPFRSVIEASGLTWHPDVMRHTFASMAYSVRPDPVEIASQMGNSPDVFHEHYRALAHPGAGAEFFNIWPACRWPKDEKPATVLQRQLKKPAKARKALPS